MGRTRRKASVTDQEDNASSCSTPPASKDKENRFPTSVDEDKQQQIIALRKDFDQNGKQLTFNFIILTDNSKYLLCVLDNIDLNSFTFLTVEMTIKDMLANKQVMIEKLTLPFCTALLKMPVKIKKMKWGDYMVCINITPFQKMHLLNLCYIYFAEIEKKSESRNQPNTR